MAPGAAADGSPDVLVVGGGMAGLACAFHLHRVGRRAVVLEGSDRVGGRVATELVDGFRIDRGFQVLPTAYPEARAVFDYDRLLLRPFYPGALVRFRGSFTPLPDPRRRPLDALRSLRSPVFSARDLAALFALRRSALAGPLDELLSRPDTTTLERLRSAGVSDRLLEAFFRPFLGGIFLERELETSSRFLDFVLRMFATGPAAVPADGMGALPAQLEAQLPADAIRTGARVTAATPTSATLSSGEVLTARVVVVALDAWAAAGLAGEPAPPARSVVQLAFSAARPPLRGNRLVLDGEGRGPVNNLAVMSEVAPTYAPPGRSLVSASVVGDPEGDDEALERSVREHLAEWFGDEVEDWCLLRIDRVRHALPVRWPEPPDRDGTIACGDHTAHPSLQGALASGRRAAADALARLGTP